MPEAILDPEQQELAELEERITQLLSRLREELESAAEDSDAPAIDPTYVTRFAETARRLSVQLSNELPPQLEPEAVAEIRKIIINMLDSLERLDPEQPLDAVDHFFLGAEAMRHIVRDALDEHVGCNEDDSRPLISALQELLPRVSQADLARLAGMSTRHLQRLAKNGGPPPRRLVLVTRLARLLTYAWTPEGVVAWFYRDRRDLDGHAPIDVLGDPGFERPVLLLARQTRAGHGS